VFKRMRTSIGCRKYEARLEDYLQGVDDSELNEHLTQCAGCRAALEDSRMGVRLLRDAWEPTGEPRSTFLAGVMARIREEKTRAESPAAFWNPLEFLASRLSLTAAALLFALSVYMVGFAPRRMTTPAPFPRTELRAADFPQPPGDPDSNEEVLQSLGETDYGN
jgi:predicted anti-sigma-YlaC factor YlaD